MYNSYFLVYHKLKQYCKSTAIKKKSSEGEKIHLLVRTWLWVSENTVVLKRRVGIKTHRTPCAGVRHACRRYSTGGGGDGSSLLVIAKYSVHCRFLLNPRKVHSSGSPIPVSIVLRSRIFSSFPHLAAWGIVGAPDRDSGGTGAQRRKPSVAESASPWCRLGGAGLVSSEVPLLFWRSSPPAEPVLTC